MPHTRCYRDGALCAEDFPLDDVSEHLQDASAVVWVDLPAPDLADLQLVADELGLHTLAVEDATTGRQRPKFNRYAGHDFLTAYAVHLDVVSGELITGEIAAFITSSALVTVRKDDAFPIDGLLGRWDDSADLTRYGVGALVHGLLDFVVDGHFDAVQSLDDEIELLEDLLFDDLRHDVDVQRRSFELRKTCPTQASATRQGSLPQRSSSRCCPAASTWSSSARTGYDWLHLMLGTPSMSEIGVA
jgi:magnesium transporter